MKTAIVKLKSIGPMSQSRYRTDQPKKGETHEDFENRTWRDKCHSDEDGNVLIPPMSIKFAIQSAGKRLGMQIKGKGKKTYTAVLTSGMSIPGPIYTGWKKDDLKPNTIPCNSDGVRGSGKRVLRTFPTMTKWEAEFEIMILDDAITNDILRQHLEEAGKYVGIGQGRAETGNDFGRFEVSKLEIR